MELLNNQQKKGVWSPKITKKEVWITDNLSCLYNFI